MAVDSKEVLDFLGSIPLLQQLPGASVQKIADVVKLRHFEPGEMLVHEGSPGEGLYFLYKGQAEVSASISGTMMQHTMPILKPGDYFGYACSGPVKTLHKADINAITELTCFVLGHEDADLLSSESIWATKPDQTSFSLVERILQLETLEVDLYRGVTEKEYPSFGGNVFGGQLLGQALAAASKSVDPSLLVHSLHSYFLRTGDDQVPIIYKVERTRDGHTFATRQVLATQKGRVIFTMYASFQRPVDGVEHQQPMPDAPNPDEVPPWEKVLESYRTDPRIPLKIRQKLASMKVAPAPLELRFVEPIDRVMRQVLEPRQRVWMRSKGKLSDDQALQRCVAAYASDWTFIETALRPHKHIPGRNEMQVLSLDHSMWFHKPFRADEWLLYVQTSPEAGHGRGLVFGQIYTQSGELVISTAQEGMLRKTNHGVKSRL